MNKRDLINYYQLAFINGVNDAISVIMLYKVFVVLMTGNIIYFIADMATNPQFTDMVRATLLINFVISGIVVHNLLVKKSVKFRIILSLGFVIIYCFAGRVALTSGHLQEDSLGFLIVANIATIMSIITNNVFYRFHSTKINLVAYTMNLLNLAHMFAEKRYFDLVLISTTIISFVLGLTIGAFLTILWDFYTILIIIPILIYLYWTHNKPLTHIN
ncbi:DUF1275 family protein [Fastidiosibacter lacustris]|uniref:DUF1275 family protein n=1 Tax=Fastidiosibacter lacustris TaxID=2056695 RepID=UPI000E34EADE|nr:DUF1275 family protein [Fastidiosibacter lacustris]